MSVAPRCPAASLRAGGNLRPRAPASRPEPEERHSADEDRSEERVNPIPQAAGAEAATTPALKKMFDRAPTMTIRHPVSIGSRPVPINSVVDRVIASTSVRPERTATT